jgi:hypothetical protein
MHPSIGGWKGAQRYGYNADVDADEDVWEGGGNLTWAAEADTTTVVSTSADDQVAVDLEGEENDIAAGTHAWTVEVVGLDANYAVVREVVGMMGVTPVQLATEYLRILDMRVLTAGTSETNSGIITANIGASGVMSIAAGQGEQHAAAYTAPARQVTALTGWWCSLLLASQTATVALQARPAGGLWQTVQSMTISSGIPFSWQFPAWIDLKKGTDVRVRATAVSAANAKIWAGFDIAYRD